jgi:hypothetical protein
MLTNVYGDETTSCSYVFKWQERLLDGQLDANNYRNPVNTKLLKLIVTSKKFKT